MLSLFAEHIHLKALFTKQDALLVAVSGGVDSMVLCELLKQNGFIFSVVHCNFKLRGPDSNGDEQFVKEYCIQNKLPFFSRSFDTKVFAEKNKLSIQMAARDLRYAFFDELMTEKKFNYLLTAHHLNDNIETFFINLLRGAGMNGLKGINEKKGHKVRPLLPFTKDQIIAFAKQHKIAFRTDSSNSDDKYVRNYLRLNVLPKFKEINPRFEDTLKKELELFERYTNFITAHFQIEKNKVVEIQGDGIRINISLLLKSEDPELLLFEILKDYQFNSGSISQILESTKGIPGKIFTSDQFELVKDREHLIIQKKTSDLISETIIEAGIEEVSKPVHLKFTKAEAFKNEMNTGVAYLNADKLIYPLKIRTWQKGDKFKPLGMTGYKKLSDLFVDLKLDHFAKNKVLILENGNKEIIWVLNTRLDERYKITENTKQILRLELIG
jgi:tRNA(Ile)-lysidine synthase